VTVEYLLRAKAIRIGIDGAILLYFKSSGYTGCVASDIGKTVVADAFDLGPLVYYDNSAKVWIVTSSGSAAIDAAVTITSGTGAGTLVQASSSAVYTWTGLKSVSLKDANQWLEIDRPHGPMLHHHIKSPHFTGEIDCYDFASMLTALFKTYIDANGNFAVSSTDDSKHVVSFMAIHLVMQDSTEVYFRATGFRVRTWSIGKVEVGSEAVHTVEFMADLVVPSATG
jgi:hypothetical protein